MSRSLNLAHITEDKLAPNPASASASLCNVPGFFSAAPKGRELRRKEILMNQMYCSRYTFPSTKISTLARSNDCHVASPIQVLVSPR